MAVGERGIFPITFPRQRLGGFHSLLRCSHTKGPTLLTNPVVAVPPAPHMSACLPSSVRFSKRRHARQREGSPRRHDRRLEAKARGPETDPRCQACGYNRGNRISKLWAGNRSETGPFGVADASSPSFTRSFNTRRVERSGSPVILDASPRSISPRTSVSSSSRAASGFKPSRCATTARSRCARWSSFKQARHEHDLIDRDTEEPHDDIDEGSFRQIPPAVQISLPRCVRQIHHLLVFVAALETSGEAARNGPKTVRRNIGAPGHCITDLMLTTTAFGTAFGEQFLTCGSADFRAPCLIRVSVGPPAS